MPSLTMTLKAGLGTVDTEFPLVDVQNALGASALFKALIRLLLALHLEEPYLVALHARYRVTPGLSRLLAQASGRLLRGPHEFFALPEGYPQSLATLAVTQGDHALEALYLLSPRQDHLSGLAKPFVHELRGSLQGAHPRVHGMPPSSRSDALSGASLCTISMMPLVGS